MGDHSNILGRVQGPFNRNSSGHELFASRSSAGFDWTSILDRRYVFTKHFLRTGLTLPCHPTPLHQHPIDLFLGDAQRQRRNFEILGQYILQHLLHVVYRARRIRGNRSTQAIAGTEDSLDVVHVVVVKSPFHSQYQAASGRKREHACLDVRVLRQSGRRSGAALRLPIRFRNSDARNSQYSVSSNRSAPSGRRYMFAAET